MQVNWKKWLWIIAIVYFLLPFDLFPDFSLGIGWLDDLLVGLICYFAWQYIKRRIASEQYGKSSYYSNQAHYGTGSSSSYGSSYDSSYGWKRNGGQEASRKDRKRDPYDILGVPQNATPNEIKSAYHRQASKYHPDKVAHLGKEFQELAEERFKELNWAYEILKSRKW